MIRNLTTYARLAARPSLRRARRARPLVALMLMLGLGLVFQATPATAASSPGSARGTSCVVVLSDPGGAVTVGDTITYRCTWSPAPHAGAGNAQNAAVIETKKPTTTGFTQAFVPGVGNGTILAPSGSPSTTGARWATTPVIDWSLCSRCLSVTGTIGMLPTVTAPGTWPTAGTHIGSGVALFSVSGSQIYSHMDSYPVESYSGIYTGDPDTGTIYEWGSVGFPAPSVCEGTLLNFVSGDEEIPVTGVGEVLLPANSDDTIAVLELEDVELADLADAATYRWRYANWVPGRWYPAFPILEAADTVDGAAFSFPIESDEDQYLRQLVVECVADGETYWWAGWSPGFPSNPNWSDVMPVERPCHNIILDRGSTSSEWAADDIAVVRYELAGADGVDVTANLPDYPDAVVVESYNMLGSRTGGTPALTSVVPGNGTLRFTIPSDADGSYGLTNITYRCDDDEGGPILIPGGQGSSGIGDVGVGSTGTVESSCWKVGGLSLTKPSTWIFGMAKMLGCLANDLFVPDGGSIVEAYEDLYLTAVERPPFVVINGVMSFGVDVADAFEHPSGSGCFGLDGLVPEDVVVADADLCVGTGITVTSGQRSTFALMLLAPFYLGLMSHAVGLVRDK